MMISVNNIEVEVRAGTPADVPLLLSFIGAMATFEKLTVSATEESLHNALFGEESAARALLVFVDGKPIGYATYFFSFSSMMGRRAFWLDDLFIDPAFRGQGMGKALMAHLAGIAVQNQCARFEWIVLDWNTPAIEFYKRLGAEVLADWRICRLDEAQLSRVAGMTPDRITRLRDFATRYTAAWCSQDAASVAGFFAPGGSLTINGGPPSVGRTAITEAAQGFMTAFPDLRVFMDNLIEEPGRVIYKWTLDGTNSGPGGTGRRVRISGFEEWKIGDDGLVAESLGHFDAAEYQRQVEHGVMNQKLKAQLDRSFELTHDLVVHLDESSLALDLPALPSNRVAGQLWCIVGARESYTKAIEAGVWSGFSCSLKTPRSKPSVLGALEATRTRLAGVDFTSLTDAQIDLAFGLLEHEIQHHGQLIRFVYANGLTFPESWNRRYTV